MQLELSKEEQDLLLEVLEQHQRDLKEEIYKTEDTDFKAQLKARELLLARLLGKLGTTQRWATSLSEA